MPAPDYASEIAALEKGLASGEVTIESDGDRVTYRSVREIREGLAYFKAEAAKSSPQAAPTVTVARYSKY